MYIMSAAKLFINISDNTEKNIVINGLSVTVFMFGLRRKLHPKKPSAYLSVNARYAAVVLKDCPIAHPFLIYAFETQIRNCRKYFLRLNIWNSVTLSSKIVVLLVKIDTYRGNPQ